MRFSTDGYRVVESSFTQDNILTLKTHWRNYVEGMEQYQHGKYNGKGIVFTAGGLKYITCLWVSVHCIRNLGCDLPIEVWFVGNEVSTAIVDKFRTLNVVFKNFHDVIPYQSFDSAGFALKPMSIIHSSFEEVLFLDADNLPLINPTFLFFSSGYRDHGAIFWPDYWKTEANNPIWEILEISPNTDPEQESGQLLVNKKRCWRELMLCNYFNKFGKYYYQILYGDKDTFKFAWKALGSAYHMIEKSPSVCGVLQNNTLFGNTILQHSEDDEALFLHRNLLKWDITGLHEKGWTHIKAFNKDAKVKYYEFKELNNLYYLDIEGDIKLEKCSEKIDRLEQYCLIALSEWRNSKVFEDYLKYSYIQQNRFKDRKEFDINLYY